jgi:UDP-2,3-diacylglucosamine pyrophosphatase LpxH
LIIVMSDLHFADSSSLSIGERHYNHNLPPEVYRAFFNEIAEFIRHDNIKDIDLVLAGDIFEITRSALWLKDSLRPYAHNDQVTEGSALEGRISEIMDAIAADQRVSATLDLFRNLTVQLRRPVRIHYIPGNHDRLLNASRRIRNRTRSFLGMEPSDLPFDNQYLHRTNGEAKLLIRHGHEYDAANFGVDVRQWTEIPTRIEKKYYDSPTFGDIVTTEIAAKLPILFKEYYTEKSILDDQDLSVLFQRLIDFDNVRPSNALINFLFSTPGLSMKEVWRLIEPIFVKMLDDLAFAPDIGKQMIAFGGITGFSASSLKAILKTRLWRRGLPFWMIKTLLAPVSRRSKIGDQSNIILNEECLQIKDSPVRCIVSGHTHNPLVQLMKVENGIETYYINTGTFRNVITATPNLRDFGRLRSKARVLIFKQGERNPEYDRETGWSFDFTTRYGFGASPAEKQDLPQID